MMTRSHVQRAVLLTALLGFSASPVAAIEEPRAQPIVISRPTVIAFFMPGRSKELSSAARADFERYAAKAAPALKETGVDFHEINPKRSIEIEAQGRVQLLKPRFGAGYYFVTAEGKTRVEYGIKTDVHLLQYARQYLPRTP
jgi:hypothetical protein